MKKITSIIYDNQEFSPLKGDPGEPGQDGATGQTGPQGPQGDSFQPIEDVTGLVLANTLGTSSDKAITQKAVTQAMEEVNDALKGAMDLEPFMDIGSRPTTVGSAVGELADYSTYRSIHITSLVLGDTYHVKGKRGTSGALWAKVKNHLVTEVGGTQGTVVTDTVVVDGTFDEIVFNFNNETEHYLRKSDAGGGMEGQMARIGDYAGQPIALQLAEIKEDVFYHHANDEYDAAADWLFYIYDVLPGTTYSVAGTTGTSGSSVVYFNSEGNVIGKEKFNSNDNFIENFNTTVTTPANTARMGVSGHKEWATQYGDKPHALPQAGEPVATAMGELAMHRSKIASLEETVVSQEQRLQAVEDGQGVKKQLKILCIGNSLTQDSFCYAPFILKSIRPDIRLTIGIAYYGGANLQDHHGFFSNDSASYTYQKYTPTATAWTSTASQKPSVIAADEEWDVVFLQQQSTKSGDYGTYQPYMASLVKMLMQMTGGCKFAWNLTHAAKAILSESVEYHEDICEAVQAMDAAMPVEVVNPYGTAIQNARTTAMQSIGTGGNLTYDGTHLQEGIPALIANYATILTIADMTGIPVNIIGESVGPAIDDAWVTAHAIPGANGSCVGITEANCRKAQVCAIMAHKHPYAVTDCSYMDS